MFGRDEMLDEYKLPFTKDDTENLLLSNRLGKSYQRSSRAKLKTFVKHIWYNGHLLNTFIKGLKSQALNIYKAYFIEWTLLNTVHE